MRLGPQSLTTSDAMVVFTEVSAHPLDTLTDEISLSIVFRPHEGFVQTCFVGDVLLPTKPHLRIKPAG